MPASQSSQRLSPPSPVLLPGAHQLQLDVLPQLYFPAGHAVHSVAPIRSTVGMGVGDNDGESEGAEETLGATDSTKTGEPEGVSDGAAEGEPEGASEGAAEGETEGAVEGAVELDTSVNRRAEILGAAEGAPVGDSLGADDGEPVLGAKEGTGVFCCPVTGGEYFPESQPSQDILPASGSDHFPPGQNEHRSAPRTLVIVSTPDSVPASQAMQVIAPPLE